jgi:hypothetical protein
MTVPETPAPAEAFVADGAAGIERRELVFHGSPRTAARR